MKNKLTIIIPFCNECGRLCRTIRNIVLTANGAGSGHDLLVGKSEDSANRLLSDIQADRMHNTRYIADYGIQ